MINDGLLYYENGEIKGGAGNMRANRIGVHTKFYKYIPNTNQIVKYNIGANGYIVTFYSFNAETEDYEPTEEYWRYSDNTVTLNGEVIDISIDELEKILFYDVREVELQIPYLTLDDVGRDFVSYINEKLFY